MPTPDRRPRHVLLQRAKWRGGAPQEHFAKGWCAVGDMVVVVALKCRLNIPEICCVYVAAGRLRIFNKGEGVNGVHFILTYLVYKLECECGLDDGNF